MFGPRISTVFRSRWNALFWSLSILATAYCTVPSPEQGERGTVGGAAEKAAETAARNLAGVSGSGKPAKAAHANPWAKDPS